jgi:hypothetical protein
MPRVVHIKRTGILPDGVQMTAEYYLAITILRAGQESEFKFFKITEYAYNGIMIILENDPDCTNVEM